MAERDVYRGEKVHVLRGRCPTCIFRPGNLMNLEDGRCDGMVADAVGNGGPIVCHSTIHRDDDVEPAVCRGFFDEHADEVPALAVATEPPRGDASAPSE